MPSTTSTNEQQPEHSNATPSTVRPPAGGAPLSLSSCADAEQLVRGHGSLFLVTDHFGNIAPRGARELGLFMHDTRFLSHLALRAADVELVHLSSERAHDAFNQIDLMMTGTEEGEFLDDPQNYIHVRRRQLIDDSFVEELTLTSYLDRTAQVDLTFSFDVDFADIFEVRGAKRKRRGELEEPLLAADRVTLGYAGLDGVQYASELCFVPAPSELTSNSARFRLTIPAGQSERIQLSVVPRKSSVQVQAQRATFGARGEQLMRHAEEFRGASLRIRCSNGVLQQVLDQSLSDLGFLRIQAGTEHILAAGIPWFCAPFGRDALIASYSALTLNPALAKESLRVLASYQGTRYDEVTEEEPGKIFHELRFGEMARTRETPHTPYYGSIDATPLFVVVAEAAYNTTGDRGWLEELAPAIEAALLWIDARSERGSRFVTYARKSAGGLDNQGWKDSRAAVVSPDGRRGQPPIALCEIQGYCAHAYAAGAKLLKMLGRNELAARYASQAEAFRELLNEHFWLPELGRYAYAIDGSGEKLSTVVSNLGHLLWSGVTPPERARKTAELLLDARSFSGFGIRTLAAGQAAFNPLSYHNGTVWPHDNALIVSGFAGYALTEHATAVFEGLIAAMHHFRDRRLPELFCGLAREEGNLVRYPVACSPQAWAAATPFLLFQSVLGLHLDATERTLAIRNASLPPSVDWVELENLRVGQSRVHIRFHRVKNRVHVENLEVSGAHLRTEIEHF